MPVAVNFDLLRRDSNNLINNKVSFHKFSKAIFTSTKLALIF